MGQPPALGTYPRPLANLSSLRYPVTLVLLVPLNLCSAAPTLILLTFRPPAGRGRDIRSLGIQCKYVAISRCQ